MPMRSAKKDPTQYLSVPFYSTADDRERLPHSFLSRGCVQSGMDGYRRLNPMQLPSREVYWSTRLIVRWCVLYVAYAASYTDKQTVLSYSQRTATHSLESASSNIQPARSYMIDSSTTSKRQVQSPAILLGACYNLWLCARRFNCIL
jgi:hypothetical protein